jgi:HEAT repeat protein
MLRSRANELRSLIRRLGSGKRSCVDAARARLAIIGPRAVDDLIHALEGDNNRLRRHVMPLLALIQDARGRAPLTAMLLDRSFRLREVAARCLGRFPSAETVAALERVLERDRSLRVRLSAVQALVELHAAGEDRALFKVLELISDAEAPARLRVAALPILPRLRSAARSSILERLSRDPDASVRDAASRVEEGPAADCNSAVAALASNDYAEWNEAVGLLASRGVAAVEPLVAEMHGRAHDPEFCKRAGIALKAMGPRRARAIADALAQIDEPLPLQVLVEAIGALGVNSQIYRLQELIDRLAARDPHPADVNGWDAMQRVRACAHLELARIGSRVAVKDLSAALADDERRVELEMLAAVELIGKPEEIPVLLSAYGREDAVTRQQIAHVVRAICKRERVRRNSRLFRDIDREQSAALLEILPAKKPRRIAGKRPQAAERQAPTG